MRACCSRSRSRQALASGCPVVVLLLAAWPLAGQFRGFQAASVAPPAPVQLRAGAEVAVPLIVRIRPRYHINSHQPLEDYLIPTSLEIETPGLEMLAVDYPEAELVTYSFSESPLSVYSGEITITARLKVPSDFQGGLTSIGGNLRYQACNEKSCLAPTSAAFSVPIR